MHSAEEAAHSLSELIEATPEEASRIALLLHQHGLAVFWSQLEDWGLPAGCLEKLLAVRSVLQLVTTAAAERNESHGRSSIG